MVNVEVRICLKRYVFIPEQLFLPSPVKPGRQRQVYDPTVFSQTASGWQLVDDEASKHSFISVTMSLYDSIDIKKHKPICNKITQNYNSCVLVKFKKAI